MPEYLPKQERDVLTFVLVTEPNLDYGFSTKNYASLPGASVSSSEIQQIGHGDAPGLPQAAIRISAANSPKPPRSNVLINFNPGVNQQRHPLNENTFLVEKWLSNLSVKRGAITSPKHSIMAPELSVSKLSIRKMFIRAFPKILETLTVQDLDRMLTQKREKLLARIAVRLLKQGT